MSARATRASSKKASAGPASLLVGTSGPAATSQVPQGPSGGGRSEGPRAKAGSSVANLVANNTSPLAPFSESPPFSESRAAPKADPPGPNPTPAPAGLCISLALSGGGIRSASVSSGVLCELHGLGLDGCVDAVSCVSGGGYTGSSYTLARAAAAQGQAQPHAGWAQEYFRNFYDHGGYLCNFAPMRGSGPHGEPEGGRPGQGSSRVLHGIRDVLFFFAFFALTSSLSVVVFLAPAIIWSEAHYLLLYELLGWDRVDLTVWVETLTTLLVLAFVLAVLPNCLTTSKTQWLASSCRLLAFVCTGYAGGMFLLEVVNRMLPYVENSAAIAVFCLLVLLLTPRTRGEEILLMLFVLFSQVRHGLRFPDAKSLAHCEPNATLFQLSSYFPSTFHCVTLREYFATASTLVLLHLFLAHFALTFQTQAMSRYYEWRLQRAFYPRPVHQGRRLPSILWNYATWISTCLGSRAAKRIVPRAIGWTQAQMHSLKRFMALRYIAVVSANNWKRSDLSGREGDAYGPVAIDALGVRRLDRPRPQRNEPQTTENTQDYVYTFPQTCHQDVSIPVSSAMALSAAAASTFLGAKEADRREAMWITDLGANLGRWVSFDTLPAPWWASCASHGLQFLLEFLVVLPAVLWFACGYKDDDPNPKTLKSMPLPAGVPVPTGISGMQLPLPLPFVSGLLWLVIACVGQIYTGRLRLSNRVRTHWREGLLASARSVVLQCMTDLPTSAVLRNCVPVKFQSRRNEAIMPYITFMSDGGHTENTAMFPLLYEQKPFIVCVDSGADPSYKLDDVLQCVAMARAHLGCSFEPLLLPVRNADGSLRDLPLGAVSTEDYLRSTLDQGHSRVAALRVQYPGRDAQGQPVTGVVVIIKPQVPQGTDVTKLNALCCDCCVTATCSPLRSNACCSSLKYPNTCTGTQFFPPLLVNEYHLEGARGCAEALSVLCHADLPVAPLVRAALGLGPQAYEPASAAEREGVDGPAAPGAPLPQQLLDRARAFCLEHSRPSVLYV